MVLDVVRTRLPTAAPPQLLMLYVVLRALGARDANAYRWLLWDGPLFLLPGFLHKLVHHVWAGYYASQADEALWHARGDATGAIWRCMETQALLVLYDVLSAVGVGTAELQFVSGHFVHHLFDTMERAHGETAGAYMLRVMQVILALHEQCLLYPANDTPLRTVQARMSASDVFSENVVYLLNRASSATLDGARLQFLVLKLLASLFALPETAHFFYMNDLKVLVDVFLRQISNLPTSCELLRQAYLSVLYELVTQTQLGTDTYKRVQTQHLLQTIVQSARWDDVSGVTLALVRHCLDCAWVAGTTEGAAPASPPHGTLPSDETLHQVLVLRMLQTTAAALVCLADAYRDQVDEVMWPEYEPHAPPQDKLGAALDILSLEAYAQRNASRTSVSSTHSEQGQRRPAPRPPMQPGLLVALEDDVARAASVSMPDLTADVRHRRAPPLPPAPTRRRAPAVPAASAAPAAPAASAVPAAPVTLAAPAAPAAPSSSSTPPRGSATRGRLSDEAPRNKAPTSPAPERHRLAQLYTRMRARARRSDAAPPGTAGQRRRAPPPPPPRSDT